MDAASLKAGLMQHTSTPFLQRPGKYVIGLILLGLLLVMPIPTHADTAFPHHAGLVVRDGNGNVTTRCVDLGEDGQASGEEVLRASGLSITAEYSSMGAAICKIGNDGCSYPAEDCFCQCTLQPGQTCMYWSYWHLVNNQWQYSQFGTTNYTVHSGEVEGWSWGAGTTSSAVAPPVYTFSDLCVATPTNTPTPTSTPASVLMSTVVILTPEPTHTPQPATSTPVPPTSAPATATAPAPTGTPQTNPTPQPAATAVVAAVSDTSTPNPTLAQPVAETATPVAIAKADTSSNQRSGTLYLPFVNQAPAQPGATVTPPIATDIPIPPTPMDVVALTTQVSATEQATPSPTGSQTGDDNLAGYVLFAVVTAGLAGTLLILRLRRH
jgi:hypothetical protein